MKTEKRTGGRSHRLMTNEVDRTKLVDTLKYMNFDLNNGLQGIVKLAAEICNTPFAQVTLLDDTNQYSMARKGMDQCITNRELSFCTHTIKQYDVMVIEDTTVDKRFLSNPFVTTGQKIRFYAGAPLTTKEDLNLGALCVLDICPKIFGEDKKQMLKILAEQALYLMELQRSVELLKKQFADIERQNNALSKIAFMQSHEFRLPVANILGLMNIIKDEGYAKSEQYFLLMEDVVRSLDEKIHIVVASAAMARDAHVA